MLTIGFDPEFFFQDKDGKFISAVGLVGGSKDNPMPIGNGCFVQEDNVAVEFNTPAIVLTGRSYKDVAKEVHEHFQYVFNWVEENVCKKHDLTISKVASAIFDEDQLQTEAAKTFGCDPDYNAYTGQENPRPRGPEGLRTCGGHIHIGYGGCDKEFNRNIIKELDSTIGLLSVLNDPDARRRQLYGKAGAYRDKSYGVEYRTLSNYWIFDLESIEKILKHMSLFIGMDQEELQSVLSDSGFDEEVDEQVEYAINANQERLTKYLLEEFGVVYA